MIKFKGVLLFVVMFSLMAGQAFASMDIAKVYKEVFSTDEKPACVSCHTDKLPKKADGEHDLNDYGQKLVDAKTGDEVDEAALKTVGQFG